MAESPGHSERRCNVKAWGIVASAAAFLAALCWSINRTPLGSPQLLRRPAGVSLENDAGAAELATRYRDLLVEARSRARVLRLQLEREVRSYYESRTDERGRAGLEAASARAMARLLRELRWEDAAVNHAAAHLDDLAEIPAR